MNKRTWITNALAALMIVLAAVGALCGAAVTMAQNPLLYGSMSRAAVKDAMGFASEEEVTAYIGLDWQEQDDLAGEIANVMRMEFGTFDGEQLNEKERQHMLDVRSLVQLAQKVSQGCMTVAAALAVIIAWTGAKGQRRGMPVGTLIGAGIIGLGAFGVYGLLNAQGFEALFVRFHELFFANDLWLMNPETDILIRMMPQLLFERAAMDVVSLAIRSFLLTWAMLCAVYLIVGGMIWRQLTERKH